MKRMLIFLGLAMLPVLSFGQLTAEYYRLVKQGEALYSSQDFKGSAQAYVAAFKTAKWRGTANDRYNAACSWALAGSADSAFLHLYRIARKSNYANVGHISTDGDLESLHGDVRWKPLLDLVKKNKDKEEVGYNKPVVRILDTVYVTDQGDRQKMDKVIKDFGMESPEMKELSMRIMRQDSVNLIKVTKVLDKFGWLGPDVIGPQGNTTLFLVIQHADLKTQQKYLPLMREAAKKGNAQAANLALLEDRVALGEGRKQIYGSQIHWDQKTGKYFVAPIEDEAHVNERRAAAGLEPLEDYVRRWNIVYRVPKE